MSARDVARTVWDWSRLVGVGIVLYSLRERPGRLFAGSALVAICGVGLVVGITASGEPESGWLIAGSAFGLAVGAAILWWGLRVDPSPNQPSNENKA